MTDNAAVFRQWRELAAALHQADCGCRLFKMSSPHTRKYFRLAERLGPHLRARDAARFDEGAEAFRVNTGEVVNPYREVSNANENHEVKATEVDRYQDFMFPDYN